MKKQEKQIGKYSKLFAKMATEVVEKNNKFGHSEIAKATGLIQSTVGRILKGEQEPSLDKAMLISKFLGYSIDELCREGGTKIESKDKLLKKIGEKDMELDRLNAELKELQSKTNQRGAEISMAFGRAVPEIQEVVLEILGLKDEAILEGLPPNHEPPKKLKGSS